MNFDLSLLQKEADVDAALATKNGNNKWQWLAKRVRVTKSVGLETRTAFAIPMELWRVFVGCRHAQPPSILTLLPSYSPFSLLSHCVAAVGIGVGMRSTHT